jgi:predicted nucleic acid-binding protein
MAELIDTNVLIDYLRGHEGARTYLEEDTNSPQISAITVAELYAGARTAEKQERLARFISAFTVRPVTSEIARLGGIRRGSYSESHGTDLADGLIGATAESEDLELVTRNERHCP